MSKYVDLTGHPITPAVLVDQAGNLLEADDTDGQAVLFAKARNYVWDTNSLAWVRETQPGSSGGGGAVTVADGADVTQGSIADVKVVGDNPGTLSAKLRGINTALAGTLTVGGTVTANAGTNLNTSALAVESGGNLATISQSVVAQATALGSTKNQLAAGSVTTNAPVYVTGNINPLSLDTAGLLRASLKDTPSNTNNLNINLAASAATVTVGGTVTTTPPSNASTNVAQFGGTNVSTGTGTGGVGIPRVTVSNDSQVKIWDGTTVAAVIAGTTALKSDTASIAGTATAIAAAGVQKVGIVGGTNTSLETTAGVLDENIKNVGNSAVSTIAAGSLKVGVWDGTTAIAVNAKGTQGANGLAVQELKDAGRSQIMLSWEEMAGTAAAESALTNFTLGSKAVAALTAASSYTVTTGKTLRIQAVTIYLKSTSTVELLARFRIRSAASAIANNSPVILDAVMALDTATVAATQGDQLSIPIPDGLEIPSTNQITFTWFTSANSCTVGMSITGYEY